MTTDSQSSRKPLDILSQYAHNHCDIRLQEAIAATYADLQNTPADGVSKEHGMFLYLSKRSAVKSLGDITQLDADYGAQFPSMVGAIREAARTVYAITFSSAVRDIVDAGNWQSPHQQIDLAQTITTATTMAGLLPGNQDIGEKVEKGLHHIMNYAEAVIDHHARSNRQPSP